MPLIKEEDVTQTDTQDNATPVEEQVQDQEEHQEVENQETSANIVEQELSAEELAEKLNKEIAEKEALQARLVEKDRYITQVSGEKTEIAGSAELLQQQLDQTNQQLLAIQANAVPTLMTPLEIRMRALEIAETEGISESLAGIEAQAEAQSRQNDVLLYQQQQQNLQQQQQTLLDQLGTQRVQANPAFALVTDEERAIAEASINEGIASGAISIKELAQERAYYAKYGRSMAVAKAQVAGETQKKITAADVAQGMVQAPAGSRNMTQKQEPEFGYDENGVLRKTTSYRPKPK